MFVLVTYDVATADQAGKKRLGKVARVCLDFGQRVQNSVFECQVDPAQWVQMKTRLLNLYDGQADSLRFYFLGSNWRRRVEHHGAKAATDPDGPLII
jgi:CRISPR-associated protein Cas2